MKISRDNNYEYAHSLSKLRLVVLVPQFKKLVIQVRKEFKIPEGGYKWIPQYFAEFESGDMTWDQLRAYGEKFKVINHLHYSSSIEADVMSQKTRITKFQKKMIQFASIFNLPMNLVDRSFSGVPYYILTNEIKPDRSFEIYPRSEIGQVESGYLNVRLFEKLNDKQLKEMVKKIKELQEDYFKKPLKVNIGKRGQISRDLEIVERLAQNTGKPKTIKEYNSVYLDALKKSGASQKQIKAAEKQRPQDIVIKYDQLTSATLAKQLNIRASTVRTAKNRINKLAKEWFGVPLFNVTK